ncbi:hypothetical protein J6590_090239 [Homalodisca vitripennis]|nr:hypothetical protein J6590_090239 [Homalodisca vitripennis]
MYKCQTQLSCDQLIVPRPSSHTKRLRTRLSVREKWICGFANVSSVTEKWPVPTLWCGVPWISQQLARAREKAGKDRPRLVEVRLDLHKPYGAGDLAAVLI